MPRHTVLGSHVLLGNMLLAVSRGDGHDDTNDDWLVGMQLRQISMLDEDVVFVLLGDMAEVAGYDLSKALLFLARRITTWDSMCKSSFHIGPDIGSG